MGWDFETLFLRKNAIRIGESKNDRRLESNKSQL